MSGTSWSKLIPHAWMRTSARAHDHGYRGLGAGDGDRRGLDGRIAQFHPGWQRPQREPASSPLTERCMSVTSSGLSSTSTTMR